MLARNCALGAVGRLGELLGLAQRALLGVQRGDVLEHADRVRGASHRHVVHGVPAHPYRAAVPAHQAALEAMGDAGLGEYLLAEQLRIASVLGVDERERVDADQFVDRVAEQRRVGVVGAHQPAILVLDRRRQRRVVEQRAEVRRAVGERRLGVLAMGDVALQVDPVGEPARAIVHGLDLELGPVAAPVLADVVDFEAEQAAAARPRLRDALARRYGHRRPGDEVGDRAAAHLVELVTRGAPEAVVDPGNAAFRIGDRHQARGARGHRCHDPQISLAARELLDVLGGLAMRLLQAAGVVDEHAGHGLDGMREPAHFAPRHFARRMSGIASRDRIGLGGEPLQRRAHRARERGAEQRTSASVARTIQMRAGQQLRTPRGSPWARPPAWWPDPRSASGPTRGGRRSCASTQPLPPAARASRRRPRSRGMKPRACRPRPARAPERTKATLASCGSAPRLKSSTSRRRSAITTRPTPAPGSRRATARRTPSLSGQTSVRGVSPTASNRRSNSSTAIAPASSSVRS